MNELVFCESLDDVKRALPQRNVLYVTDEHVHALYPHFFDETNVCVLPAGEDTKSLANAEEVCRKLQSSGIDRGGAAVAVGGGVVGDLAGFAAALYMRGINFYTVPTTLLAMVDSAIGGKTAVNLDGYKNIIGAFWMPVRILLCPAFLQTLPARELRCGMGELLKTALLDSSVYDYATAHASLLRGGDPAALFGAVRLCAAFKKSITDRDPKECGARKSLNLGHTVGHALEKLDGHRLSHGEYVLSGLLLEAAMVASSSAVALVKRLVADYCPPQFDFAPEDVEAAAAADKKNRDGRISVLALEDVGKWHEVLLEPQEFAARYAQARTEAK